MLARDFETELRAIDERFMVIENPNRPGLSNILFNGKNYDLPTLSTHNIKDEPDPSHRYEFPNGMSARHHTRPEILSRVHVFLEDQKSGKYDGFYE